MHKGSRLSRSFGTIGTTPAKCLVYFHPSDQSLVIETAQPSSFNKSAGGCQAPAARPASLLASSHELTRVCPQCKPSFFETTIDLNRSRRFEFEYHEAEYEKAELLPTQKPVQPFQYPSRAKKKAWFSPRLLIRPIRHPNERTPRRVCPT